MRNKPHFSIDKFLYSLPGRVTLTVLAALVAATLTPQLFRINHWVPFSVLRWGVVAMVGLASGLTARRLLSERTSALRIWTAWLAVLIGLIALGLTSGGAAGAELPDRSLSELNWTWMGQFGFSALLAWLALAAWPVPLPFRRRTTRSGTAARRNPPGTQSEQSKGRRKNPSRSGHSTSGTTSAGRKSTGRLASGQAGLQSRSEPGHEQRSVGGRGASRTTASQPIERTASSKPAARTRPALEPERTSNPSQRGPVASPGPASSRHSSPAPGGQSSTVGAGPAPSPAAGTRPAVPIRPPSQPPEPPNRLAQRLGRFNSRLKRWWRTNFPLGSTSRPPVSEGHSVNSARENRGAGVSHRTAPGPARKPIQPASRNTGVRLVGEEEHRCPFCLEIVQPEDRRGIIECPICHTRHHADCWAVTGTCQVPHYHG